MNGKTNIWLCVLYKKVELANTWSRIPLILMWCLRRVAMKNAKCCLSLHCLCVAGESESDMVDDVLNEAYLGHGGGFCTKIFV